MAWWLVAVDDDILSLLPIQIDNVAIVMRGQP
jgi:hypothetical protein